MALPKNHSDCLLSLVHLISLIFYIQLIYNVPGRCWNQLSCHFLAVTNSKKLKKREEKCTSIINSCIALHFSFNYRIEPFCFLFPFLTKPIFFIITLLFSSTYYSFNLLLDLDPRNRIDVNFSFICIYIFILDH